MKNNLIIYQWIYIIVATVISTIALFYYAKALPELIPNDNLSKEAMMCSGQLFWQGAIVLLFIKRKLHSYLYHMITVSLLGSLMLVPMILLMQQIQLTIETRLVFFFLVVGLMIIEHVRRVKKLNLPPYLTVSWITYRILWLPILLF